MGTNFYVRLRDKKHLREEVMALAAQDKLYEVQHLLNEHMEEVHIAKRSGGWKFLFQSNPKYYPDTKAGVDKFLRDNEGSLYDEYGDPMSTDEFWRDFYDFNDGYDAVSYCNAHPDEYRFDDREYKSLDGEGLRFTKDDFC